MGAPVWIARPGLADNDGHDSNATRDACNMDGMAMAASRDALAAHRRLRAHMARSYFKDREHSLVTTDAGSQPGDEQHYGLGIVRHWATPAAAATTQSRTLGALVALPSSGHSFIGLRSPCSAFGMTRFGTFAPFARGNSNVRHCQNPTLKNWVFLQGGRRKPVGLRFGRSRSRTGVGCHLRQS